MIVIIRKRLIKIILQRILIQNRNETVLRKRKELWNKSKTRTTEKRLTITEPLILEEQKAPSNNQDSNEMVVMNINTQNNKESDKILPKINNIVTEEQPKEDYSI